MCEGFAFVRATLERWFSDHPRGFPPTVLHLTADKSSDGDPTQIGKAITRLSTDDGPVLLFNCHLSTTHAARVAYPTSDSDLPDEFARTLFNISSQLPEQGRQAARQEGLEIAEGAKGFVFNGDAASVAQFVEIGTAPAKVR